MGQITKGISFTVNDSVTNAKLHQLIENAAVTKQIITDQALLTEVAEGDQFIIYDVSADSLKKVEYSSVNELLDDSVATSKLQNDAVTTIKVVDNAITTNKINAAAVTSAKIADANITKAKLDSFISPPSGMVCDYLGSSAPTGWVFLDGRTLGSATSGATNRANADTQDLFTLLWNSLTNTEAAVSSGRGASASADFAANKTITLPDARGRILVGKDDMGGTAANRVTTGGSGLDGVTLGKSGGAQTHTLASGELPSHTHGATGLTTNTTGAHTHGFLYSSGAAGSPAFTRVTSQNPNLTDSTAVQSAGDHSHTVSGNTASAGSGTAHNNVQPSLIVNKIIKL